MPKTDGKSFYSCINPLKRATASISLVHLVRWKRKPGQHPDQYPVRLVIEGADKELGEATLFQVGLTCKKDDKTQVLFEYTHLERVSIDEVESKVLSFFKDEEKDTNFLYRSWQIETEKACALIGKISTLNQSIMISLKEPKEQKFSESTLSEEGETPFYWASRILRPYLHQEESIPVKWSEYESAQLLSPKKGEKPTPSSDKKTCLLM